MANESGTVTAQDSKTLALADFGDIAKDLYTQDPDWEWDRRNVQKFIPWEQVSAERKLQLIAAAQGLAAFINAFERDIPLSVLRANIQKVSIYGADIDTCC